MSAGEIERMGREVKEAREAARTAGSKQDQSAYKIALKVLVGVESTFNKAYSVYASEMRAADQRPKTHGELTN